MPMSPARLELRLGSAEKDRIARAAALRGQPVSAFVREAVLREADAAIAKPKASRQPASPPSCAAAAARLSTDEIMKLTRGG